MLVERITSSDKISACFDVYLELRPYLKNKEDFIKKVLLQQQEGFQLAAIFQGEEAVAAIGFRFMTTFAWGKILYIDDLTTKAHLHGKGYGTALLDHAIEQAKELHCDQVHLDSGYTRNKAHRLYLRYGFELTSHHFSLKL
ncbi:MAG: GNAT family N-acetyltransferase [Chthoniobacterales bacterium]